MNSHQIRANVTAALTVPLGFLGPAAMFVLLPEGAVAINGNNAPWRGQRQGGWARAASEGPFPAVFQPATLGAGAPTALTPATAATATGAAAR